ncbi:MAG: zf-TFIIB domain-containing protein, partial [Lentisphaeria bacterium]|nr:zf-TFIIB domain-containing protein [Lentisphaeria bacterium]
MEQENRLCPRCGVSLTPTALLEEDPIEVDVCHQCRGIWFDAGELKAVLHAVQQPDAAVNRQLLTALGERRSVDSRVTYAKCPVCSEIMNRRCYGHRSGVIADSCRGHGVWLDGGELEALFAWVAAGGHVLDEKVTAERQAQEAKREEERRRRIAAMGPLPEEVPLGMGVGRFGRRGRGLA